MAEVYLAEDTRLDRRVALKLLPPTLAADQERFERFEREAKTVAALNHPNIVTIYAVEESEGNHFITMELVEGQTLTELIPPRGMPIVEALGLACTLGKAMAVAHGQGITHRDIKPDNIMITKKGTLKILDFGLAKPAAGKRAENATLVVSTEETQGGLILGTVAYMSPEQALGKPVDFRSDIFSFGVLLYEVATGKRPFRGDNSFSIIDSILKKPPTPANEVRSKVPQALERVLERCLEKDPDDRYQSTLDLVHDLEEVRDQLASGETLELTTLPAGGVSPLWKWASLAAIGLAAALAGVLIFGGVRSSVRSIPAALTQATDLVGSEAYPSLSPDGRQLVYAMTRGGPRDIHLLRVGGDNPINLTRDSGVDNSQPVFSPDGEQIVFRSERDGGGLFLMGATGESVRRLTNFGFHPTWSPDGLRIAFSTDDIEEPGIRTSQAVVWIVDVTTGEAAQVIAGDASQPSWSPNGERIAYWGVRPGSGQRDIWTAAADGSDPRALTDDAAMDWNPVWSADGRHVYFASDRGGSRDLWRLAVDQSTGKVHGPPEPVTIGAADVTHPAVARDGSRLAFASQATRSQVWRLPFDPETERVTGPGDLLLDTDGRVTMGQISKSGEWLLYWTRSKRDDLVLDRIDQAERRVLVRDDHRNTAPAWCEDDRSVVFSSDRDGRYELWAIGADGSGLRQLTRGTTSPRGATIPVCSDDGSVYYSLLGEGIAVARFDGPTLTPNRTLRAVDAGDIVPWDISPDRTRLTGSHWLEGVTVGIAVLDIESESVRIHELEREIPAGRGLNAWLADGRRVAYAAYGELMLLDTETMETRAIAGAPSSVWALLDVAADGRQLIVTTETTNADIWTIDLDQG